MLGLQFSSPSGASLFFTRRSAPAHDSLVAARYFVALGPPVTAADCQREARMFAKIHVGSNPMVPFALLLAVTMSTACGQSPVDPGASPGPSAQARSGVPARPPASGPADHVSLCHRTEGSNAFVPLTVAAAAVDAHLTHGDVRVGDAVPGQPGAIMAAACTSVATTPATIDFGSLTVNGAAISSYTEEGFDVIASGESWQVRTTYGNPPPFIFFAAAAGALPRIGSITITAGGATFRFNSVDVYSSTTSIPYTFTGLLGSTVVFSVTAIQPQTFGQFATVLNPHAGTLIDSLVISLTNSPAPCCGNPVGLDNIVLTR